MGLKLQLLETEKWFKVYMLSSASFLFETQLQRKQDLWLDATELDKADESFCCQELSSYSYSKNYVAMLCLVGQ